MGYNWRKAQQGVSGLWFKPGYDDNGRKHLLVSETKAGVDTGSHDHYWQNSDGTFGVQIKNKSGYGTISDSKGHIFPSNTSFSGLVDKYLENLFDTYF
ncbi:hypothetical protein IT397_02015 [Candidatus Nomurabacteria bacterium]|nr:hypothetical protein [Candidatus Nomurabacteria bacterium]